MVKIIEFDGYGFEVYRGQLPKELAKTALSENVTPEESPDLDQTPEQLEETN